MESLQLEVNQKQLQFELLLEEWTLLNEEKMEPETMLMEEMLVEFKLKSPELQLRLELECRM